MTDLPRRARRQTAECPKGVGGLSPFPMPGRVTALRALRTGREVELDRDTREFAIGADGHLIRDDRIRRSALHGAITRDRDGIVVKSHGLSLGDQWGHERPPSRAEYRTAHYLIGHVGDPFSIGAHEFMPLDDQLRRLAGIVGLYCRRGAHIDVSDALHAIQYYGVLGLQTRLGYAVVDLARRLHAETARRDYTFVELDCDRSFTCSGAIDEWCSSIGCGTVFVDLTVPHCRKLPNRLIRNLLSDHYHLWPIIATPSPATLYEALLHEDPDGGVWRRLRVRGCVVEVAPPLGLLNGGAAP